MEIALWIIAVCEILRMIQNIMQLRMMRHDKGARDNAYAEFIKSLKTTDRDFVKGMLDAYERVHDDEAD